MTEKITGDRTSVGKLLPIEWPEGGVAAYANNLMAVTDGTSSYLTFCQISPPAIMGTEDEQQQQLEHIKKVKAELVVKLIVPLPALREMVRILEEHIGNIDKRRLNDVSASDN